jgi:hypothetical protein
MFGVRGPMYLQSTSKRGFKGLRDKAERKMKENLKKLKNNQVLKNK